jgi:hypothetical protein
LQKDLDHKARIQLMDEVQWTWVLLILISIIIIQLQQL